jgi:hypothetical protein
MGCTRENVKACATIALALARPAADGLNQVCRR